MRGSTINIATYYNCGTSLTLPSFFAFVFKKSFTKNFTLNFLFEPDENVYASTLTKVPPTISYVSDNAKRFKYFFQPEREKYFIQFHPQESEKKLYNDKSYFVSFHS